MITCGTGYQPVKARGASRSPRITGFQPVNVTNP
jgi:hypothetical protein